MLNSCKIAKICKSIHVFVDGAGLVAFSYRWGNYKVLGVTGNVGRGVVITVPLPFQKDQGAYVVFPPNRF